MRELKFRAWVNDHWVDWLPNSKTLGEYNEVGIYADEYNTESKCFIEQYTGLKDKNGKEIYEGDIVDKEYDNLRIYDGKGVVGMGYLYDSDGYNNGTIYGWKAGDSSLADVCGACEVIGNIHENPELISKRKLAEYLRGVK